MAPRLLVSLASVDQAALGEAAARLVDAGVDGLHLDVSDGVFVPDITLGSKTVAALRKRTRAFLDVHLMVSRPEEQLRAVAAAGADRVTFHVEAAPYPWRLASLARTLEVEVGLALNPATPLTALDALADGFDVVDLLTTEPDFAGERLLPRMAERVAVARAALPARVRLQVDGGLDAQTAPLFVVADELVIGRGICAHEKWADAVAALRSQLTAAAG